MRAGEATGLDGTIDGSVALCSFSSSRMRVVGAAVQAPHSRAFANDSMTPCHCGSARAATRASCLEECSSSGPPYSSAAAVVEVLGRARSHRLMLSSTSAAGVGSDVRGHGGATVLVPFLRRGDEWIAHRWC